MAGYSSTADFSVDVLVIKINQTGEIEWSKTYGGPKVDAPLAIAQSTDGKILIACNSASFSVGATDLWILELNPDGSIVWQNPWRPWEDYIRSLVVTVTEVSLFPHFPFLEEEVAGASGSSNSTPRKHHLAKNLL